MRDGQRDGQKGNHTQWCGWPMADDSDDSEEYEEMGEGETAVGKRHDARRRGEEGGGGGRSGGRQRDRSGGVGIKGMSGMCMSVCMRLKSQSSLR